MRYLVRVAEFTDLSGYQVSLVFLDLHGTDVLLAQREEREASPVSILPFHESWVDCRRPEGCRRYLLLLLFPLLVAGLTVRVLRGGVELICVFSDQNLYRPFHTLVLTQGVLIEDLLFLLLILCPTGFL